MNTRSSDGESNESPETATDADATDESTLKTRIAVLEEENARLRKMYGQVQRTRYRRTAFGLLALGVLATFGGLVFSDSQTVLFALGGTGLFAGVLTYYLTPERFIAATVGEQVYAALAESRAELTAKLGLANLSVYVPSTDGTRPVRLFVPQHADYELPDAVDRTFVTADGRRRGVAFHATGTGLYEEFERALDAPLAERPAPLTDQLAEAIVEQFELAGAVRPDVDESGGRAVFEIGDSAFGRVDRFDHPVPSFAAVGLARALERPIEVDVTAVGEDQGGEYLVRCQWRPDE
jgi:hypothetical protein